MNFKKEVMLFLEATSNKTALQNIEQDATLTPREKDEEIASLSKFKNKHGISTSKDIEVETEAVDFDSLDYDFFTAIEGDLMVTSKNVDDIQTRINSVFDKLGVSKEVSKSNDSINVNSISKSDLKKISEKLVNKTSDGYKNKSVSLKPYNFEVLDLGDSFEIIFYVADMPLFTIATEVKGEELKESITIKAERFL